MQALHFCNEDMNVFIFAMNVGSLPFLYINPMTLEMAHLFFRIQWL